MSVLIENIYCREICKAKKGKKAGPDGVKMDLIQNFPAVFPEILYNLFTAGSNFKCAMKD